jgi:hypothetical protein
MPSKTKAWNFIDHCPGPPGLLSTLSIFNHTYFLSGVLYGAR